MGLEGLVCEIGGGFKLDFCGGVWFFWWGLWDFKTSVV